MARKRLVAIVTICAVPILAALAIAIGTVIPRNGGWRPPAQGVRIYIEDNGIHTGIVVPAVAAGVDWRGVAPAAALRDPRYGGHGWRSFGWGHKAFYIGTPTWADVDPLVVAGAAVGIGESVMHVDFLPEPRTGPDVRALTLRPEEYRRLAARIRASFADGPSLPGYGPNDAFFPAHGRYSAVHSCNAWTGDVLAAAGVRIGAWTPLSASVMAWMPPA